MTVNTALDSRPGGRSTCVSCSVAKTTLANPENHERSLFVAAAGAAPARRLLVRLRQVVMVPKRLLDDRDDSRMGISLVARVDAHQFLNAVGSTVTTIQRTLGVLGDTVNPIQLTGFVRAVTALRHEPLVQRPTIRVKFDQ